MRTDFSHELSQFNFEKRSNFLFSIHMSRILGYLYLTNETRDLGIFILGDFDNFVDF